MDLGTISSYQGAITSNKFTYASTKKLIILLNSTKKTLDNSLAFKF